MTLWAGFRDAEGCAAEAGMAADPMPGVPSAGIVS